MKKLFVVVIVIAAFSSVSIFSYAGEKDILRQGLLGAGAGAAGGWASGAKGKNVWKGALAGAGVNVVGGALLDSMSGEHVDTVEHVDKMSTQDAYKEGYNDGFNNGYKQGYTEGFKDGVAEMKAK